MAINVIIKSVMQKQEKINKQQTCELCQQKIPFANMSIHKVRCKLKKQSTIKQQSSQISLSRKQRSRKPKIFQQKQKYNQSIQEIEQRVPCSFCGYMQNFSELDSHPKQCLGQAQICKFCGESYPLQLMQQHVEVCQQNDERQNNQQPGMQIRMDGLSRLMELINNLNLIARGLGLQEQQEGLSQQKIKQLKCFKSKKTQQDQLCTICYCKFQQGQQCTQLKCKHIYHKQCISKWFQQSSKCPVCKHDQNH